MESCLNGCIALDHALDLALEQTVGQFVNETNVPHFQVFGLKDIVGLNRLKLQGSLFSLLDEHLLFMNVL
mgnify:FL=1